MPGSTPFGGQITPLDCESLSLSGARPVVSPGCGGCTTSGGQSRCVDGFVGLWAYKGEVEIAARIAADTAAIFKLCMGYSAAGFVASLASGHKTVVSSAAHVVKVYH
jgi:hypothetical protein